MTSSHVERWEIFERPLEGPADGNSFLEVQLTARFRHKNRVVEVDGFYDGAGVYLVRFMPDMPGAWRYETQSNVDTLSGISGEFTCVEPSPDNHGPVRVRNTFHLAYADGTPYFQIGTTCYAWIHQGDALEEQTLATLRDAPFNKLRMCVFPKDMVYNKNEPELYPFEGAPLKDWDFTRFNPAFFRHLEKRVAGLCALGIEADLILFHPYDRWGFAEMDAESDDRYLRYIVARLSAYRNVWWSMANEYNVMKAKTMLDWDRFFRIVQESDPYQHLRSVHNLGPFYDHTKPWVTHQSIQNSDLTKTRQWREEYRKPVVVDECTYEGDIPQRWGAITAQEMVHRFWEGTVRGGYVGHGETYRHPEDILWWAKGGVLRGQSPERIAFLRRILEEGPPEGLNPTDGVLRGFPCAGKPGEYYLGYLGVHRPGVLNLRLPEDGAFAVEVIDPWEMTIATVPGEYRGECSVEFPAKPYLAARIRRRT